MSVEIAGVLAQNITVAYKTLNPSAIDTRKIKTLVTGGAVPAVMDNADRIVAIWPSIQLIIEMGDSRIRVTSQRPSPSIGDVPLWDYAATCDQLVQPVERVAYGFNYDVEVVLKGEDAVHMLIKKYVANRTGLEQVLGGILLRFNPRLIFQRDDVQYDLIMEPMQADRIKLHCNVHFDSASLPLPPQMCEAFRQHFEYVLCVLPPLLEPEAH